MSLNDDISLAAFDKEKLEQRLLQARQSYFPETGLRFIDDHFGPRPGCIHTLMGSTGSGKSTLMQSMLMQWGRSKDILVFLTEEEVERFELKLYEKNKETEYLSPNLHLVHEQSILRNVNENNHVAFLKRIEGAVASSQAKMLIIDNLTTSIFYESNLKSVLPILSGIRNIAKHYKIPVFVIVHTKKGVNEVSKGLMEPDDVRGSASIANTSDYFYTFYRVGQTFVSGSKTYNNFIFVNKSRDHDNQGCLYRLDYHYQTKTYTKDKQVNFNAFKEIMKSRDKL